MTVDPCQAVAGHRFPIPRIGWLRFVLHGQFVGRFRFLISAGPLPGVTLFHVLLPWRRLAESYSQSENESDRLHIHSSRREIEWEKWHCLMRFLGAPAAHP